MRPLQVDFVPRSITGLYEGGVVQMMDRMWGCYHPSSDALLSAFSLGPKGHGSVEVVAKSDARSTFLVSTSSSSGLRIMLIGVPSGKRDAWGGFDYSASPNTTLDGVPRAFSTHWDILPGDAEYPPSTLPAPGASPVLGDADLDRARAISTAIYGTLVGTLRTHNGSAVGIGTPSRTQSCHHPPESEVTLRRLTASGSARSRLGSCTLREDTPTCSTSLTQTAT